MHFFLYVFIYLLKAYSPVNRTGSTQGFSQVPKKTISKIKQKFKDFLGK